MNNPVLPIPKREHVVLEDKNQSVVLGLMSNKIIELVKSDSKIDNITSYYSAISRKYITIIFYYE